MISYVWNASGVVLNDNKNGKILGPHALRVLMHWGIPLFHHEGTDTYTTKQVKYHYVLHNAAVMVTNSNGCPT